jgi:NAD(P)H dehydrogenase (quinone)
MKKRILIIHAHPEQRSFCSAIKDTAIAFFEEQGAEVQVSDLYQMGFDPVGGKHDFRSLKDDSFFKYQLEQVNAEENGTFVPEVRNEMDKFLWADTVIFNFPLWWFGLPAILKGWVDRVFAMGTVYGNGKGVYDNGTFKEKIAFITMTTGGPEIAYGPGGKNGSLDTILFPIHHGMFYFVGMKVMPPFISFSPARSTDGERSDELKRLEDHLTHIESMTPLFG